VYESKESKSTITVEVVKHELETITVRIDLTASPRQIERQLARVIKPFRCPKTPEVRDGVMWMVANPGKTPGEASQHICGSDRLTRRIGYWASKLIVGGSR
jgi:hypothetical protein